MKTVHKYLAEYLTHDVPIGYTFGHVGIDGEGEVCVWLVVNKANRVAPVELRTITTGTTIPDGFEYVGTSIDPEGFVEHVVKRDG